MARRAAIAALLFTLIMGLYIVRLAWLQLTPGSNHASSALASSRGGWKRMSVAQRQRSLVLDTGRGDFLDRSGRPITGETYSTVALFPILATERGNEQQLRKLAGILKVNVSDLTSWWDALRDPSFWHAKGQSLPYRLSEGQVRELSQLQLQGIKVLPYRNRYIEGFNSKQAIGYTSQHPEWLEAVYPKELASGKRMLTDQVGGAGLEKSLDKLLRGIGATSVSYFVDSSLKPMKGLDLRITQPNNSYYPLQIGTTLDLELQNRIEAYADSVRLQEGAIVVLDTKNADIVAMVSRPMMDPEHLGAQEGKPLLNHALIAAPPGSVFKLVTEAAALEAGVANEHERFTCTGEYGRYGLSCWKEGGHGTLTLREGLAQSCNIAFATIAERMSAEQFARTAAALGVGRQAGWHAEKPFGPFREPLRLLGEEEAGQLFDRHSVGGADNGDTHIAADGGVMAQSAIGQRDVQMTPLQAANLVVTLLNKGRVMEPRLVREIRYASGQRMVKFDAKQASAKGVGRIHPATARVLLRGMEAVVDHGTGRSIRQGVWTVAGKSGTANVTRDGKPRVHQWFTGYGPAQSPRYAVAVLSKYRPPNSPNEATKLFRGVMDIIAETEQRSAEP
ncbi:penicillin-binding protein 2 [Paenibacillus sp. NEAU-GSW1]|uniref:peptidoglycan D,D-transpeptidase FtsI family protein n=1 Tax=Paenibacillus sp. NEAU-GSW1 TaxID=2682486 RepID=UPI0012E27345|nr:penicillin-binding transpeptidase domain-containing protein [Paenibacillus sp. NEAU-GSW1]MUT67245.1 penicillin-binding protein [Paenibacillus sp. NEAU-GSW1]